MMPMTQYWYDRWKFVVQTAVPWLLPLIRKKAAYIGKQVTCGYSDSTGDLIYQLLHFQLYQHVWGSSSFHKVAIVIQNFENKFIVHCQILPTACTAQRESE